MEPRTIIVGVHYAYPGLVLLCFMVTSTAAVCTLQTLSLKVKDQRVRRDLILWLMFGVICQYIIHALLLLIRSIVQADWAASPDEMVYLISSALVWGIQFLALMDSKFPVWYPYYINWVTEIIVEIALLVGSSVLRRPVDAFDFVAISLQSLRICNFIFLPCLYFGARNREEVYENDDAERQSLLRRELAPRPSSSEESGQNANEYGTTMDSSNNGSKKKTAEEEANEDYYFKRQREDEERIAKRLKSDGNWWIYMKGFLIFLPYVWPLHSKILQFRAILTGLCLLTANSLNLLVPRQLGAVTDALVAGNSTKAWVEVAIYAALTFANSNACIGWLQFWLWQPLEQYCYDALNAAAHAHVMSLSSEFHESRTSSDILNAISQGKGIKGIVDTLVFKLVPTFIDLFLVFAYLYYLFGPYMALNLAATTLFYLYTTAKLVSLAVSRRRVYHTYFRKELSSGHSSVRKWRVASYFNNIPHEESEHYSNIKAHLRSERTYMTAYYLISVAQNLIMALGLLGACFLAAYQVIHRIRSPGDFVILLTYWAQLRGPLSYFSSIYKTLSEGLMDAERLLDIFQTRPTVVDKSDAEPLKFIKGDIHFNNVRFAYDDRKDILKGINLKIAGGSTVAIVGETGSGKSTTLKLLHRFYDVKSGSIEIDGQDIRNVTVKSLREIIAVVPQDPTLFSETIMANIRYAKLNASNAEVFEACKSAAIHDKIISMPNGYNSEVGNSAVKLSGGEQQRIAIARAILKQSPIILLDEATSSVDTETEQLIQAALNKLCYGRTTVIVAHRLSTIMRADQIVVMKDGSIIEEGSHDKLIRLKGKYHDLWAKQILHLESNEEPETSITDSPRNGKARIIPSRSRSESPHKNKLGIVNDLDTESNKLEISKLTELAKTFEGSHSGNEGSHTSKHPKLKPDAPEFYPRHLRGDTEGTDDSDSIKYKKETKNSFKKERDKKNQEDREQRPRTFLAKKAAKNANKSIAQLSDIEEPRDDSQQSSSSAILQTSQDSITSGTDNKSNKAKIRRPRVSSRRNLSKSEPVGQDGTNDSEDQMTVGSEESQALLGSVQTRNRRVSAPSDPSLSQQESRSSSFGVHPRRPRHWRVKNRPGNSSRSVSTSDAANPMDASMDDGAPPNPPTTSPAGGLQSAEVSSARGSK